MAPPTVNTLMLEGRKAVHNYVMKHLGGKCLRLPADGLPICSESGHFAVSLWMESVSMQRCLKLYVGVENGEYVLMASPNLDMRLDELEILNRGR